VPEEKSQSSEDKLSVKVLGTPRVRQKRSFIKHMISVKDFSTKPTPPRKEVHGRRPGGYKQARVGVTPATEAKPEVSSDMIRTMNEIIQGRKSTQLRRPAVKDAITRNQPRKTTADSKIPHQMPKDYKEDKKQEEDVVAAATAAAHRAGHLKLEEARLLNYHCERKKAGFFISVFRKLRGRKKEKYCVDIEALTSSQMRRCTLLPTPWDCSYDR
jgi:hypothetical protein